MGGSGTGTLVSPSTATVNTLADIMLEVARLLGGLRSGTATGGSTTTLVDTSREEEAEFWKNGTLWITSGSQDGSCVKVTSFNANTLTFGTLTGAIVAGVTYSVLPEEFTLDMIRIAVQASLPEMGDILDIDTSLVTTTDDEYYTLPTGVSNIYRVEIAGSDTSPYAYAPNYYWKEVDGTLQFIPSKKPGVDGYKMRLWYKKHHPEVSAMTDGVDNSVDINWLKWLAVTYVLRNNLSVRGKDKAITIDLLNQALQKETEYRNRHVKSHMNLSAPDPRLNP